MGDAAVVCRDVHVTYRIAGRGQRHLRNVVARGVPVRHRTVKAVRGVSMVAREGTTVGVIGRNGSGKSTLLRAIAGLMAPSRGEIHASERPVLLGVGAALKGDLTGRQNLLLGGAAVGLKRREVTDAMEEIVEFAGLEEFIDFPLRTYSSGMKARLQFSVATAARPRILLVDEALAVGDGEFKARSSERVKELVAEAGTVFLVSHSLSSIKRQCDEALWLEKGEQVMYGSADDVVTAYREDMVARRAARAERQAEREARRAAARTGT